MLRLLTTAVLCTVLSGCSTFRNLLDDPPIVASVNVGSVGAVGEPLAWVRSDAEIVVAHATVDAEVFVWDKATGATLHGPLRVTAGKRFVYSRKRDYSETLDVTDPLPAWSRIVFRPSDLGQLSITFEEEAQ